MNKLKEFKLVKFENFFHCLSNSSYFLAIKDGFKKKSLLSTQIYPAVAMNNTLYKSEAELSLELMVAN